MEKRWRREKSERQRQCITFNSAKWVRSAKHRQLIQRVSQSARGFQSSLAADQLFCCACYLSQLAMAGVGPQWRGAATRS
jgi:hypothetical protein